jgi:hypothetical protein
MKITCSRTSSYTTHEELAAEIEHKFNFEKHSKCALDEFWTNLNFLKKICKHALIG